MSPRPRVAALHSAAVLAVYWLLVFPQARRELRGWEVRARRIPDPALRCLALQKLRDEGVCAEGVAAFALLAGADRATVVRFCVAFEVMYDLIDGLGEQPLVDPLANNRRLARAFEAAIDPAAPALDWYAFDGRRDDGGYLDELIAACRAALVPLPAYPLVAGALRELALRAGEAQSLNHSGTLAGDTTPLARWAAALAGPADVRWWEAASAAAAPLGIYALCALATRPDTDARDAAAVEAAYAPWIAGLLAVLESMVDREQDEAAGTHSYASHYASGEELACRATLFARRAAEQVRTLRQAATHRVILAGMVATNLSHQGAADELARRTGAAVRAAVGGPVAPLLWLLRLRRAVKRLGEGVAERLARAQPGGVARSGSGRV